MLTHVFSYMKYLGKFAFFDDIFSYCIGNYTEERKNHKNHLNSIDLLCSYIIIITAIDGEE